MKKIVSISMGLLAILAISCSKKNSPVSTPTETAKQNLKEVSITVGAPEDIETKVAYAYDETEKKLKLTWEDGDKITLQKGSDAYTLSTDTDNITSGGKMATFTGSVPEGEGTYDVFYAGKGTEAMTLADVEALDYSVQTQSANGNTSHLKFAARLNNVTFTPGEDDIYFTADWAKEHGNGTYQQSGAIRIRLQNPGVTSLKSVTLTAPSAIFPKTNALSETSTSLTVSLPNASIKATDPIVVYAMLPWSQDGVDLPAGDYTVSVTTEDFDVWTKTKAFEANTLSPVAVNSIGLNKTEFALQDFYGGSGVEGDPYLIANARQMGKIDSHLSATKTYYKLVDDIDMTGVTWTSLNADGTNVIDLNGNSKKISNMRSPLFADLNGNVHDLTLFNSVVSSAETVGILANTCNTAASTVSRVTVTGDESPKVSSLTNTATSERKYVGGLVGEVSTLSTFEYCHVINTTIQETSSNCTYTGGAFGYIHHDSSNTGKFRYNTVETCVIKSSSYVGGLVGHFSRGNVHHNKVGYDSDGNQKKCTITGINDDSTGDYKGGLIGYHRYGYVQSNEVYSDVKGANNVGGLIGYAYQGIENNSTAGDVTSSGQYTGGLVGYSKRGDITCCSSSSAVSTSASNTYVWVGGLVGGAEGGKISKCSATGNTNSSNNKAGLAGLLAYIAGNVTIESCYATGNVAKGDGNYTIRGGLVGKIESGTVSISNSYATGEIQAQRWSGGLIGEVATTNLTVTNCYTSSVLTISGPAQAGVFIGKANENTISYSGIIAWNTSGLANFIYQTNVTTAPTGNYFGKEGTISSHAKDLGWEEEVWDFDQDAPRLKWTLE